MLRFAQRLAYRDAVLSHLGALLLMYPRGRQFSDDFPTLRVAIKRHFEDGAPAAGAALELAATILAELLGKLGTEERAAVVERLRALDGPALEALAERRLARRSASPADPIGLAAEIVGVALFIAGRMAETGTIGRREHEVFVGGLEARLPGSRLLALEQARPP